MSRYPMGCHLHCGVRGCHFHCGTAGRTGRLESPHRGRQTAHMGRIFETRKATMFARWDKMSKAFARIGKEITIAVKAGGPNPDNNPSLRRIMQNARALNMPKDKVEAAIKRASGQGGQAF